ncbi:endonuclease/exonuclease/phosphatase family protein [Actinomadura barringtoniae]|uniref:Endonuclease/exonuclease/phosphatase family protein n=1 Tax=Actinomadura barringtoniae TaxID=1427535 RepID=A0A939TAR3_9ACTN|nr:endonuclease/exonuclease/phosphatase family protein [Actinomadura barringtoniae]MBO2449350.1 endonuclease/exonuclease/phosphatase family protein [Actinomadura barringtoniae]
MRAPRAVVPLLAVTGATVVVVTAGAGAAIKGGSSGHSGPASAADTASRPAVPVNVLTWNVCGNKSAHCPLGADPAKLAATISYTAQNATVDGTKARANVVFLQEVCSGHVKRLGGYGWLRSWSWAFAPAKQADGKPKTCANGQGQFGVALGSAQKLGNVTRTYLKSPKFEGRVAVCANVASWSARLCTAHLSSGMKADDPTGAYRKVQTARLKSLVGAGTGRVVLGGDFNDQPTKPALDVLYGAYRECDQGTGVTHGGESTHQNAKGKAWEKLDYIFTGKTATVSCDVPNSVVRSSDHRPVIAAITLR